VESVTLRGYSGHTAALGVTKADGDRHPQYLRQPGVLVRPSSAVGSADVAIGCRKGEFAVAECAGKSGLVPAVVYFFFC
jgi:hypothetical protein